MSANVEFHNIHVGEVLSLHEAVILYTHILSVDVGTLDRVLNRAASSPEEAAKRPVSRNRHASIMEM